jgi:hypothetical protein
MADVWALFVVFLVVIGAVGFNVLHKTVSGRDRLKSRRREIRRP